MVVTIEGDFMSNRTSLKIDYIGDGDNTVYAVELFDSIYNALLGNSKAKIIDDDSKLLGANQWPVYMDIDVDDMSLHFSYGQTKVSLFKYSKLDAGEHTPRESVHLRCNGSDDEVAELSDYLKKYIPSCIDIRESIVPNDDGGYASLNLSDKSVKEECQFD